MLYKHMDYMHRSFRASFPISGRSYEEIFHPQLKYIEKYTSKQMPLTEHSDIKTSTSYK